MQLAFDLWEPEPVTVTVADPADLTCPQCGEVSPSMFVRSLNHSIVNGMCARLWMFLNHCRAIVKAFEAGEMTVGGRNCYAKPCENHTRGEWVTKPIPACGVLEYDQKRAVLVAAGIDGIPDLPEYANEWRQA